MTDRRSRDVNDDRILTLDAIRGVAVMGILVMNIVAFAMPEAAYSNPYGYGGHSVADLATWLVDYILFDGKMRGLFSFLFGASMLLVIERAEAKGAHAARIHFARMAWLFVFGMAHLLLLWWGDILNHYALVGAVAWFFRKLPPHKLVAMAVVLLLAEFAFVVQVVHGIAADAAAVHAGLAAPDVVARHAANRLTLGQPDARAIARDLAIHRGSYATIFADRLPAALAAPREAFVFLGAETLAYMLLGMASLRSGLLRGEWPRAAYRRIAAWGLGIGVLCYAAIACIPIRHGFNVSAVAMSDLLWSEPVRPVMILGWACLIILLLRPGGGLTMRVAAAGRMAFTNYIVTTAICTTLFYGYGFGLYGTLSRTGLIPVVMVICAAMLGWSKPWLDRFRYGPLEWVWRSLVRQAPQRMRRSPAE